MIDFEIDGKKVQATPGTTIIEAADANGVFIPRYCYHKNLSIAANCRMCLVEVEKSGKPLPACATPVTPDMKVYTRSQKTLDSQRAVMEFLLINHPLDCPICDQGGVCELQDLAMGYGNAYSDYEQSKRAVFSDNLGPLIDTWMTRCIQCTRCVRFGEEIAGVRELGATFRGEDMRIGTYVKHVVQSELSGNIIDLCPVGALTSKPGRYADRGWELQEHHYIAPHDCVGTNLYLHTRGHQSKPQRTVMRAVPRENAKINETWMSDRDRFSIHALEHADRATVPMLKQGAEWQTVDWLQALETIAKRCKAAVSQHGAEQIGALVSPSCTLEELYLMQKWCRAVGSHNIDHRFYQQDFRDQQHLPAYPGLNIDLEAIEDCQHVLLVGSNVRHEQPIVGHWINKAVTGNHAAVMAINPVDYAFVFPLHERMIQADIVAALQQVVQAMATIKGETLLELATVKPSPAALGIAQQLLQENSSVILLGEFALSHPNASQVRSLAHRIAAMSGASVGELTRGANAAGAWLAGAVPHRAAGAQALQHPGSNALDMLVTRPLKIYFLFNVEPECDAAYADAALHALHQADFVVCMSTFISPSMRQYADVILPVAPFSETDGTFVNLNGVWQSFKASSIPSHQAKPGWKVVRALARFFDVDDFDYKTAAQVREECVGKVRQMSDIDYTPVPLQAPCTEKSSHTVLRLADPLMYRIDPLVRRTQALQETITAFDCALRVNAETAKLHQLREHEIVQVNQGNSQTVLQCEIDHRVADGLAVIPTALEQTVGFGTAMAPVTFAKIGGQAT